NSKGSRVWSMMPTAAPSGSSQMARIAWPPTFTGLFLGEDAARHRVEFFQQRRIALGGIGDESMVERAVAALRTGRCIPGDQRNHPFHDILGLVGVGVQHLDDHPDRNVVVIGM